MGNSTSRKEGLKIWGLLREAVQEIWPSSQWHLSIGISHDLFKAVQMFESLSYHFESQYKSLGFIENFLFEMEAGSDKKAKKTHFHFFYGFFGLVFWYLTKTSDRSPILCNLHKLSSNDQRRGSDFVTVHWLPPPLLIRSLESGLYAKFKVCNTYVLAL